VGAVALVRAGDEVIVTQNIGRGALRIWRARITKVARVWVELEEVVCEPEMHRPSTWKMRLDTQQENVTKAEARRAMVARFWTLAQWERKVTLERARELLAGQGIRIEYTSPWSEREVELAELLRSHLEQHP
jgi:hypothetical protein